MAYTHKISDLLRRLDRREYDYFSSLSDEQKKAIPGPVALRFMSTIEDSDLAPLVLMQVNEIANVHFYNIHQHPELQWKLLASCGCGAVLNHTWISNTKPAPSQDHLFDFLQSLHPSANDEELDILFGGLTRTDLLRLIQDCALTDERSKIILNAYDKKQKH